MWFSMPRVTQHGVRVVSWQEERRGRRVAPFVVHFVVVVVVVVVLVLLLCC